MQFKELLTKQINSYKPDWKIPHILLAIDPGETTGYSFFFDGNLYTNGIFDWKDTAIGFNNFIHILDLFNPNVVVCEDYRLYANRVNAQLGSQIPTIKIIGAIEMICSQNKIPLFKMMASQAKGFIKDDKLKEFGYYKKVNRHARDSIRVGCHWLLFSREVINE
jgi:hypothetical protein